MRPKQREYFAIWQAALASPQGILLSSAGDVTDLITQIVNSRWQLVEMGELPDESKDFAVRAAPWSPDDQVVIVPQERGHKRGRKRKPGPGLSPNLASLLQE